MPKKTRRYITPDAKLLCDQEKCNDPVLAIQQRVARLIDDAELATPPTDLELLASYRDITRIELTSMKGAGRLVPLAEGIIIQVNQVHSLGKRNFTSAHEIVHTLIPSYSQSHSMIYDKDTGVFNQKNEIEYLCDVGASAMLLDPRWLIPRANARGPCITTLLDLANVFQASLQATAIALAESNLWGCAIVFWEEGWRKKQKPNPGQVALPSMEELVRIEPELRVVSGYATKLFQTFIPKNKSVERTTSVYECFKTESATRAVEEFAFGRTRLKCYAESVFVPYKANGEFRRRVVTFLMRDTSQFDNPINLPSTWAMEFL